MKILIDSREKEKLDIRVGANIDFVEVKKLAFGDYACEIEGKIVPIFFERKSIGDLWGTFTQGIDRFKNELELARESKVTIYLAIEPSMQEVYAGYEHSGVFGSQIIRSIFTFKVKYGLEPIFCGNRDTMKYHIYETFDAVRRNFDKNGKEYAEWTE